MKFLPALLSLLLAATSVSGVAVTDLSNGAELAVNITSPSGATSSFVYDEALGAMDVPVTGFAHVGKGVADVAYIYVIDSSGSTDEDDGACGSTLQCVQAFFAALHEEVVSDGSAELVAVIDFDYDATLMQDFVDPRSLGAAESINASIYGGYSYGGTACRQALETAANTVLHPDNTASTTMVIFAGDGLCNGGDESNLAGEDVTDSADILANTGAIVHSIAVGDNIDCTNTSDLVNIPRNGGRCFNISDPNDLPHIVDDLIGTSLEKLEVKMDDGNYRHMTGFELQGQVQLPAEGAVEVNFNVMMRGLDAGHHDICIRATGADTLGDEQEVEECHRVTIDLPAAQETEAPTTEAPEEEEPMLGAGFEEEEVPAATKTAAMETWKIVTIVAVCAAVLAGLMYVASNALYGKERVVASEASRVTPPPSVV